MRFFAKSPASDGATVVDLMYRSILLARHPRLERPEFLVDILEDICPLHAQTAPGDDEDWTVICHERTLLSLFENLPAKELDVVLGRGWHKATDKDTCSGVMQKKFKFVTSTDGSNAGRLKRVIGKGVLWK